VNSLAESAREARKKLEEARVMMQAAGSTSRGRSANDCPRLNAERFVRAWQRETARAERAEIHAARRPTVELQQVRVRRDARFEQYLSCALALFVTIEILSDVQMRLSIAETGAIGRSVTFVVFRVVHTNFKPASQRAAASLQGFSRERVPPPKMSSSSWRERA